MSDLVLDLKAPTERHVRIDGRDYLLRNMTTLAIREYHAIEQARPRIGVLMMNGAKSSAESKELTALLDQVCRIVLTAPAALHRKLGDLHRALVLEAFFSNQQPQKATRRTQARRRAR